MGAPFRHGVASGDPGPDRVVLWTRVSGAGDGTVPVEWWVAEPGGRGRPVTGGEAVASPEHDHTVHVDADGLEPDADAPPVAVEVVGPSVTTDAFSLRALPSIPGAVPVVARTVRAANPHHRWFDLRNHGYVVLDVTPERLRADWWHVDSIRHRTAREHRAASFEVATGTARWTSLSPSLVQDPKKRRRLVRRPGTSPAGA